MITLQRNGLYKLIETKNNVKILYLDNDVYAWVEPTNIGELLVVSHAIHKTDCILSMGHYHVYEVKDEPFLSDLVHLELEAGKNVWQGYLLLSGLPDNHHKKGRIIPTTETIAGNRRFKNRKDLHKNLALTGG